MDELLQHCIRELAFEGDLGCDPTRLRDFVSDFYRQKRSTQNVDDSYIAFVWSVVAQQPEVLVGIAPEGAPQVYIAPKKPTGEPVLENTVHQIPDAAGRPLPELIAEHGEALRVAVEPQALFAAVNGSHIRDSKLTPPIYSSLKLIAGGRENGLSVVDLSKRTGYDSKTCHYYIEKLVALNLIVKLKKAGVGHNLCVHRYFFDRAETWKNIRAEELTGKGAAEEHELMDDEDEDVSEQGSIRFDPIGAKHLTRIELVKARLEKLLKNSPHNLHKMHNLIIAIGFPNPTKSERRFFQTRLRELENEGFLEIVQVRGPKRLTKCVRLVDRRDTDKGSTDNGALVEAEGPVETPLKATVTLQRQILDIVDEAGVEGATLNDAAEALCNLDKRVMDFQLNRLRSSLPPAHLSDLGLGSVQENNGRERRFKYYTFRHYVKVAAAMKLNIPFTNDYLPHAGEYRALDENIFYKDTQELHSFIDTLKNSDEGTKVKKKRGRPRKHPLPEGAEDAPSKGPQKRKRDEAEDQSAPPKKRGRPRKHPLPEGTEGDGPATVPVAPKKRGRPRKHPLPEGESASAPAPKKRGRPPKHPRPEDGSVSAPAPKRRGRPSKQAPPEEASEALAEGGDGSVSDAEGQEDNAAEPVVGPSLVDSVPAVQKAQETSLEAQPERSATAVEVPGELVAAASDGQQTTAIDNVAAQATSASAPAAPKKRGRPRKHPLPQEASNSISTATATASEVPTMAMDSVEATSSAAPTTSTPAAPKKRGRPRKSAAVETVPQSVETQQAEQAGKSGSVPDRPIQEAAPVDSKDHRSAPEAEPMEVDAAVRDELPSATSPRVRQPLLEEFPVSHMRSSATPPDESMIDPALLELDHSVARTSQVAVDDGGASAPATTPLKRTLSDFDSTDRPQTKRQRHTGPLANISRVRRQKEILQTIEGLGGMANISTKDFYAAHAAVVESLANAGEPTSVPVGSQFDKKTLMGVLSELETQGKIRTLTTSVAQNIGGARQAKVVYLSDTPQEKLNEFLASLGRAQQPAAYQPSIKILEEPLDFGGSKTKKVAKPAASVILLNDGEGRQHDDERASQLLKADEETIRASLLTENNTIVQEYGFIVGKIARARELYLHIAKVIEERKSTSVVATDPRIMHLSYFSQDIPVAVYTSVVTIRCHNEELLEILSTPEGRQTPIKDLPASVAEACEFDKWRTRQRMMDVLNVLQSLKLVTALNPSDAEQPAVRCPANGEYATTFEVASDEKVTATLSAPQYWMLNESAPLFFWALDEDDPVFWKRSSTKTVAEGEQFWKDLHRACVDEAFCTRVLDEMAIIGQQAGESSKDVPQAVRTIIRRSGQWSTMYNFSWYQRRYLSHHIDIVTAATPLQDEDGGEARLSRIAWIVSAPKDQVARFYERERHSLLNSIEKVRKRKQKTSQRKEEQKVSLAQKAAEARAERERTWDDMLARVHPEPLKGTFAARVKPVRARFLQSSGQDIEKWEKEIERTIREAKISAKRPAAGSRPLAFVPPKPMPTPPPLVVSANEKPLEELIASQGPPLGQPEPKAKGKKGKKGKGKEKEQEKEAEGDMFGRRRQRFQWTKDLDELARDASAIIRARCRDGKRLDWSALAQVFPAIARNSVRQRIGQLRSQPGAEAYFRRLEDRWHELWLRHLGTPELPDDDPGSSSNFNLVAHVKFLRSHVDKNALRVGFVETEKPLTDVLPASVEALSAKWEVVEKPLTAPSWDFMWSGVAEEGRERQLMQQAFVLGGNEIPAPSDEHASEHMFVADVALKMTLGTPNDVYDPQRASHLLSGVGDEDVGAVVEDLLDRGVLSKLVRDPSRHKPGRTLKISDANQSALHGQLAPELFQDAVALEEMLTQQDAEASWREWPLLASDGDVAALIELVSDNKVEFNVDTSHAQSVRPAIDWNSKKASDDDMETEINIRLKNSTRGSQLRTPEEDILMHDADVSLVSTPLQGGGHGWTADGERACCALQMPGLTDCVACLSAATEALLSSSSPQDVQSLRSLLEALEMAGPEGLTKAKLPKMLGRGSSSMLPTYIERLTSSSVPLALWAGYREAVLVSSRYLSTWSVVTEEDDIKCVRVLPRRWLDISGRVLPEVWNAARKAVMAIIIFHPGISQAEVRWRLRPVYDRQEVNELLQQLLDEGYVRRDIRSSSTLAEVGMQSNAEERTVLWFASGRRVWYQV